MSTPRRRRYRLTGEWEKVVRPAREAALRQLDELHGAPGPAGPELRWTGPAGGDLLRAAGQEAEAGGAAAWS